MPIAYFLKHRKTTIRLLTTSQETVPDAVTYSAPQPKKLNTELVTTMSTEFLKRLGYKNGLKHKWSSLEGGIYTVEVDSEKFTTVVCVGTETRETKKILCGA